MTQTDIEKTLDQLVRRAKFHDEYSEWLDANYPDAECDAKWHELRTAHGVVPFDEPFPSPQPASEGVRWFRSDAYTREFPSLRTWTELDGPPPHGRPLAKSAMEGRCIASDDKIADAFLKFDAGNDHTEARALRVAGFVRWWMKQRRKPKPSRRPARSKGVKRGK